MSDTKALEYILAAEKQRALLREDSNHWKVEYLDQAADELAELKLSRRQWEETATLYAQNSADKDATIAQLRAELDRYDSICTAVRNELTNAGVPELTDDKLAVVSLVARVAILRADRDIKQSELDEAIRVIEELTHPLDYDIQFAHAATFLERVKHGGDA